MKFTEPTLRPSDNRGLRASALQHCVVLEGARIQGVQRLEDSVIDRNAVVRRAQGNHQALRLMIGDDAEVSL
jgi:glucose-1-phosphate thymidylyltransferase